MEPDGVEPDGVDPEGVEDVEPPPLPPEVSRNRSLRLPRSWGVTSDTKFSAEVAPVILSVFSTDSASTFAVRMPMLMLAIRAAGTLRRCHISAAPASIRTASNKPIQIPVFEGFLGLGRITSGLADGGCGLTIGAGATLIAIFNSV